MWTKVALKSGFKRYNCISVCIWWTFIYISLYSLFTKNSHIHKDERWGLLCLFSLSEWELFPGKHHEPSVHGFELGFVETSFIHQSHLLKLWATAGPLTWPHGALVLMMTSDEVRACYAHVCFIDHGECAWDVSRVLWLLRPSVCPLTDQHIPDKAWRCRCESRTLVPLALFLLPYRFLSSFLVLAWCVIFVLLNPHLSSCDPSLFSLSHSLLHSSLGNHISFSNRRFSSYFFLLAVL